MLNTIGNFRVEFEVSEGYQNIPVYVEASLLFGDVEGHFDVNPDEVELKQVSKAEYRIQNPIQGLHEYFPLTFEEAYSWMINTMVHWALIDFRYDDENMNETETYEILAKIYFPNQKGGIRSYVPSSDVDKFYNEFLSQMTEGYEKLKDYFGQFTSRCLTPQKRESLSSGYKPARLTLPGNPIQVPYSMPKKSSFSSRNSCPFGPAEENLMAFMREKQRLKKFSDRVASHDPLKIVCSFLVEMHMIASQVFQLWNRLMEVLTTSPRQILALLRENYIEMHKMITDDTCVSLSYFTETFPFKSEVDVYDLHSQLASEKRGAISLSPRVEESKTILPANIQPVIIESRYIRPEESLQSQHVGSRDFIKGTHLFVLVHGFQGNAFDIRLLRNQLAQMFPYSLFLASTANENSTEGDIGEMGFKLSQEIVYFIQEWCPNDSLGKISLIGHSLGGIIIRAALPYLERYANKLHLYMSLSTPHLGYTPGKSRLIDAGLWLVKKWKKSKGLQQLTLTDSGNIKKSELYQLSNSIGLEWFKHVMLVSSSQDYYVPFDSVRMEVGPLAMESKQADIYLEMAQNLTNRLTATSLIKVDANFVFSKKNLDYFIGRSAHIQFLDNKKLIQNLILKFWDIFK